MLSQNRIPAVSRLLSVALQNGASAEVICDKLQQAISGTYRPQADWTSREYDIAFLIKALGGLRSLYILQVAEGYPSLSTLRWHKQIPDITVSAGVPSETEFNRNIAAFLGEDLGRQPPCDPRLGQVIMIDGVALEEVIRFDLGQNCLLGLCREHSQIKMTVDDVGDLEAVKQAIDNGECHRGKDGTVLVIAPITDLKDYFPVPLVLSPSCKTETGDQLVEWVGSFLEIYRDHPDGEACHGPIHTLATDGESSFRKLRATLGLRQLLNPESPMGRLLCQLPGLNLYTGSHGLLTTSDPKHIIKRYATLIRSKSGIQISGTTLMPQDARNTLQCYPMTEKQADALLDPADKQNVPKAVILVATLAEIEKRPEQYQKLPSIGARIRRTIFLAKVLSYFLDAFTHVEMSLSEQIRSLSTYAHLITALYQHHQTGFLTSALLADSQAIVKNILFTLACMQTINPDAAYYVLLEGTDRLEGVFSHARTHDHARNFDILQLAQKLSIGAEINSIFQRHPDLDRGHIRRNLVNVRGVDHINPKSWLGNVRVGDVDIQKEYFSGRDQANELLVKEFNSTPINFDSLFSHAEYDHLRPGGIYIGTRPSDIEESQEWDDLDDDGLLEGGLLDAATAQLVAEAQSDGGLKDNDWEEGIIQVSNQEASDQEILDTEEQVGHNNIHSNIHARDTDTTSNLVDSDILDDIAQNELIVAESDILNPSPTKIINSHYLVIDGEKRYKPDVVTSILGGPDGKKVLSRPMRAAGLTIEASLRKRQNLNNIETQTSDEDKIKTGDLGAVLVRVGVMICLAVVEILGFTQGTSKVVFHGIDLDDLDATGQKATVVNIQILDLSPSNDVGTDLKGPSWTWSGNYIRIQKSRGKETAILQRHYTTTPPRFLGSCCIPSHPRSSMVMTINPFGQLRIHTYRKL